MISFSRGGGAAPLHGGFRRVVTGFFPTPHLFVHTRFLELGKNFRRQQEVVDSQTGISLISISEVIPKGINCFVWMQMTQRISPALSNQITEGITNFG